ncbi:hypothetical protein KCU_09662 [Pasteurella multocida subsp. multocida str. P52VAC]|nr:hypothetical protein KCU_09662 [Pasteurella multocida subsp. multocida str. P52VAC]
MELQDHFLIAMPQMEDDYFAHSVVYICEHNDQGTMGIGVESTHGFKYCRVVRQNEFYDEN